MWFSAFYVLYYEILFIYLFLMIVLLNTWIYYSIFSKNWFDLIWWDKFSCNFKYIFIKKIVLIVGQINKK